MAEIPPPEPVFIRLEAGQCKVLVFDDMWYENRVIRDPKTGRSKKVVAMVLHVVQEDGRKVDKYISFVSYRAQQTLYALYKRGWLFARPIRICVYGEDYAREYAIELV